MLKKYKEHEAETSIFDEFDFMDSREEGLRYQRELSAMMYENMKKMMGYESPKNEKNDDRRGGKKRRHKKGGRKGGKHNHKNSRGGGHNDSEREQEVPGEGIQLVVKKKNRKKNKKRNKNKRHQEEESIYMKKSDLQKEEAQKATGSDLEQIEEENSEQDTVKSANIDVDTPYSN